MDDLTDRQKNTLQKFLKAAKYENNRFIFGPKPRSFFKQAKDIFNVLNIGFYAGYASENFKTNDSSELVFYYVDHYQADKLLVVLHEITEQSYEQLTNGERESPPKTYPPLEELMYRRSEATPEKKKRKKRKTKKKTS